MDHETLERVEKQRHDLEVNISKLKKALRHWQTLELDYDVLKDEFLPLPENASKDACLQAAKESGAELIDEKEVENLVTGAKGGHKRPSQIIELLTKRSDYVARNISTIRNQLSDAEKKRNALLLAEDPGLRDDAGLPLAEITEELDEEGNVVASKVQNPGKDSSQLAKVLQKAGVKGFTDQISADSKDDESGSNIVEPVNSVTTGNTIVHKEGNQAVTKSPSKFIKEESNESNSTSDTEQALQPTNAEDNEEDAKLRQEMLQYGLDEVMPIVAELEMHEDDNEFSDDDDESDDDDLIEDDDNDDNDEEDESEDELGRTKRPLISDRYRKQMEELERSLGLKEMKNLGPSPELPSEVKEQLDRPSAAEAARKAAIARESAVRKEARDNETGGETAIKKAPKKKKVAFSADLDIADDTTGTKSQSAPMAPKELPERPRVKVIDENVIERTDGVEVPEPSPPASKKTSRFKAVRSAQPQTPLFPPPMEFPSTSKAVPEGPPGRTVADKLIERDAIQNEPGPSAPDRDDFDDELHKREVAAEYYKLRNRKIHEQGGYVGEGEQDNYGDDVAATYIDDEATGKRRKVSRFKAARMKQ